ncbi:MAG: exodeoxyribonuclease VII small subunit [Candidatus Kapabacteria bacterium]|nr:exodeoxyribonuclease VII small subunit [Candidatus Kapabacteria bacterium]
MATTKDTKQKPLEEQLKRLEEIATLLDRGEAPIDEQLRLYEEGMQLAESCRAYLENAELKVRTLAGDDIA